MTFEHELNQTGPDEFELVLTQKNPHREVIRKATWYLNLDQLKDLGTSIEFQVQDAMRDAHGEPCAEEQGVRDALGF